LYLDNNSSDYYDELIAKNDENRKLKVEKVIRGNHVVCTKCFTLTESKPFQIVRCSKCNDMIQY